MTQVLNGAVALIPRWLATDDRAQAAWSLAAEIVTSGRKRSGNRATDIGVGITSGRALATIKDAPIWGGLDYLACDAFPARLDTSTGEIIAVEGYDDADTPGLAPWMLKGEKRNIRRAKGIEGFVARGNQVGDKYARAHVWIRNGELVAHHRKTADSADPPLNSTPVHDPGEGNDDWEAGLHGIMRVRALPEEFCGGHSAVPGQDTFHALLLNFTKSTGDNSGRGAATFGDAEGLLSYEAFGPLTFGAPKHRVGEAEGRETRQGAIDCDRALFGDRSDAFTAPLLFEKTGWTQGGGRFITAAHIRMDFADTHQGHCGVKPGKWKVESRCNWDSPPWVPRRPREDDPPPVDEPPGTPRDPGDPPPRNVFPKPWPADPEDRLRDSTIITPDEIQIPSEYGQAKPDLPDADERGHGASDDTTDPEGMAPTHGYTYAQALRSNVVSHEVFIPQYLYDTERTAAGSDPNARWPQKTSTVAQVTIDALTGRVDSYQPGYGPGTKVKLAGSAKAWHALAALKDRWPSSFDEHGYIIGAGKNAAGVEMAGWLGLGLRVKTSLKPASGWYIKLDYTDSSTLPDIDLRSTDENALDASTDRKFMVNGVDISGTVATAVTAASVLADNEVPKIDGASRVVQASGLYMDDVALGLLVQRTADISAASESDTLSLRSGNNAGAGDTGDIALRSGTASTGTSGDAILDAGPGTAANGTAKVGATNADAVSIGRTGKNSQVHGTLGVTGAATLSSTLAVGGSETSVTIAGSAYNIHAVVHDEGATDITLGLHKHSDTAAASPVQEFARSRGTEASESVVQNNDDIGRISFLAHDGTDYERAAEILVEVDGTPGAGDMPGRMTFKLSPDGSATPAAVLTLSQDKSAAFAGMVQFTGVYAGAGGDDVAIGGVAKVRLTSGATLTGMVPAAGGTAINGQVVFVENATGSAVTVSHDATSTAANRFYCPGSTSISIPANGGFIAEYSTTDSRWRVVSIAAGSASSGTTLGVVMGMMAHSSM